MLIPAIQNVYGCIGTPPDADFSASVTAPEVNETIVFTDETIVNDGTITNWTWDFGSDAVPATANGQGTHNVYYTSSGLKTVTLTITYYEIFLGPYYDQETKTAYIDVQAQTVFIEPGTTTVTIPSCATGLIAEAWGAGGGGTNASSSGRGGGGGGAYAKGEFTGLTPGNSITITVGGGWYSRNIGRLFKCKRWH